MPVRRWLVSGKVQGVFFRESARREAQRLGVTKGHALNTRDGTVDVLAMGSEQQLRELERWLWQGPSRADVTSVETLEPNEQPTPTGFDCGWKRTRSARGDQQ